MYTQFAIQTQLTQQPNCTECLHVDAWGVHCHQLEQVMFAQSSHSSREDIGIIPCDNQP